MMGTLTVILFLALFSQCQTAPTTTPNVTGETLAEEYISKYYTDVGVYNSTSRRIAQTSFNQTLEAMQAFFGLEVTGRLDEKTLKLMKEPRCGVSDISRYGLFLGRPKWEKKTITYRITDYTPDLSRNQIDATIAQAFKLYSDVIPLDFKQIQSGTADIMIFFKGRYHGDFYPFDGPSGVLAHSSSLGQGRGGDTLFDDDEFWTLTQNGVNLLLVAAHQFGHALGLDHSGDRKALMFPNYQYVNTNGYKLPDDDKRGVQALYGTRTPDPKLEPKPEPPIPEPEELTEPDPNPGPNSKDQLCNKDLVFDAATSMWGYIYFFKDGSYWKMSRQVSEISLTKVNTKWSPINYVDAAYEVELQEVVYLFEGNKYWGIKSRTKTMIPGYPKPISTFGFPSSVSKIDACVYVTAIQKTLFFVNNQYWSYNEAKREMDSGFPRLISQDFPGIGSKVDAVFEYYGYVYFSDGPRQSEYYFPGRRVTRILLNYSWLNCY